MKLWLQVAIDGNKQIFREPFLKVIFIATPQLRSITSDSRREDTRNRQNCVHAKLGK